MKAQIIISVIACLCFALMLRSLYPIVTYEPRNVEFTFSYTYTPSDKPTWTIKSLEPNQTVVFVSIWDGHEIGRTKANENGTATFP